jgi:hypothetical protein
MGTTEVTRQGSVYGRARARLRQVHHGRAWPELGFGGPRHWDAHRRVPKKDAARPVVSGDLAVQGHVQCFRPSRPVGCRYVRQARVCDLAAARRRPNTRRPTRGQRGSVRRAAYRRRCEVIRSVASDSGKRQCPVEGRLDVAYERPQRSVRAEQRTRQQRRHRSEPRDAFEHLVDAARWIKEALVGAPRVGARRAARLREPHGPVWLPPGEQGVRLDESMRGVHG